MPDENVVVGDQAVGRDVRFRRHDENLGKRESHALAQLVRCLDGALEPDALHFSVPSGGGIACRPQRLLEGRSARKLLVDPRRLADRGYAIDLCERRAETALREDAGGLLARGLCESLRRYERQQAQAHGAHDLQLKHFTVPEAMTGAV